MTTTLCPPISALLPSELDAEQEAHVRSCRRCRVLRYAAADARDSGDLPSAVDTQEPEYQARASGEVDVGSVALVAAPDSDEYLVGLILKASDTEATVVPVSPEIQLATEWDVLLDSSVLGYAAMAEVWNFGTVLVEQFREVLMTCSDSLFDQVFQLYRAALRSSEVPGGLSVGPPVLSDDDPRLLFQEEEAERARSYWEPAMALAGIASLAEFVASRSEELSLERRELVAAADRLGWLDALERGDLDLRRVLEPAQLAAVMRRLKVPASRRLAELVRATLLAAPGRPTVGTGLAFARRRRGSWPSPGHPQMSVDTYVTEFLEALER